MYLKPINALTQEETELLKEIDDKYIQSLREIDKKINLLSIQASEARQKAEKENRPFTAAEQAICNELKEASNSHIILYDKWTKEKEAISKSANQRTITYYTQSAENALTFIKNNVPTGIELYGIMAGNNSIQEEDEQTKALRQIAEEEIRELRERLEANKKELETNPDNISLKRAIAALENILKNDSITKSNYDLFFSDKALKENICKTFFPYLSFLSNTSLEAYKEACDFIDDCIRHKDDYIKGSKPINRVVTKYPKNWIALVDKVSGLAFDGTGGLYNEKLIGVNVGSGKSKKEILSYVKLSFDDEAVHIVGGVEFGAFDREVHDALVTLYVEGNNIITPQMVYKAMTGNKKARLTPKQRESISNSLKKLTRTRIKIIAGPEECKAYKNLKGFEYEGNVIAADRVKAVFKDSEEIEAFQILRTPILYNYAEAKNQIGRMDINLLNSPVNKSEETIILQGYLYRRISSMKKNKKMKNTILYDTIYRKLSIEAASEGALRNKKAKIREASKRILDYWKEEGFINGYTENSRKNEIVSIAIHLKWDNYKDKQG